MLLGLQHRICCDDHQHCVGDWDIHPFGFVLGILQGMDVLWDATTLFVSGLHFTLKREEVDGMEATACGLEMVQEFDGRYLGVTELFRL